MASPVVITGRASATRVALLRALSTATPTWLTSAPPATPASTPPTASPPATTASGSARPASAPPPPSSARPTPPPSATPATPTSTPPTPSPPATTASPSPLLPLPPPPTTPPFCPTTLKTTTTTLRTMSSTKRMNTRLPPGCCSFLFGGEVDEYLDLMDSNSCGDNHYSNINHHYDSVVPVQQQPHHFHLALDLDSSKSPAYPYNANPSLSQNVSFSSVDVGIVPESTEMSGGGGGDVSGGQYSRPPKGTIDLFTGPPLPLEIPSQLSPMDREARVLRYREKKKTRKFQKTIRYASRKAYAETRPRIKGRFAKRTEVEAEVDQMFSTTLMTENGGYGIVPSF
ncbi:zinc finger protein CONSTANS-LIKE 2 [Senna tora]|uniref:Zinc finger protein CONSTANS-LIKE 2 n=1 Tax=Senna tora TaxID=362788 RepID=A0A834SF29_9FABA|nr:zinc finger protein CONSTANS-LIKE 2 [Senna tora]